MWIYLVCTSCDNSPHPNQHDSAARAQQTSFFTYIAFSDGKQQRGLIQVKKLCLACFEQKLQETIRQQQI